MPRLKLAVPLLAALACACVPPLARAATVTIAPSGGGPAKTLDLGALAPSFDVHGATYALRAADGATRAVTVSDGISLGALLRAAGLDGDPFTYVEVSRPDGTSAYVLNDRIGGAGDGPPVVWADAQGVHFLRPSDGEGDANADDDFALAGGVLSLALRAGDPLEPRIAVSTLRARPHERVDFSASLAGGEPLGRGLVYQWYFDGGGGGLAVGANVSHRFAHPGDFLVLLNVARGVGDTIGLPDRVYVRIVAPQGARRRAARDSGAAQAVGAGDAGAGGGGTSGAGGAPAGGDAVAPAASAAAPIGAALTPVRHVRAPHRASPGALVSGTLLGAASAAAAPAGGAQAAGAAVARRVAADRPLHVPIGAWVALGVLALLGLGWALESRHTLPFWQP